MFWIVDVREEVRLVAKKGDEYAIYGVHQEDLEELLKMALRELISRGEFNRLESKVVEA